MKVLLFKPFLSAETALKLSISVLLFCLGCDVAQQTHTNSISPQIPRLFEPTISPEFGSDQRIYGPSDRLTSGVSVAFDGNNYLVVWTDSRILGGHRGDIWGARVTTEGELLDPGGIVISMARLRQFDPIVIFDGTNFLVVWEDIRFSDSLTHNDRDIFCARVTPHGEVLDPEGIAISTEDGHQSEPAISFDGTNTLVIWRDARNSGSPDDDDIYGARVSTSGELLDPDGIPVCLAPGLQSNPTVSFDGTQHLALWSDEREASANEPALRVAHIDMDGTVVESDALLAPDSTDPQYLAQMTSGPEAYFAVWQGGAEPGNLHGASIDYDGMLISDTSMAITTTSSLFGRPAVATGIDSYLTTWTDIRSPLDYKRDIYGANINFDGTMSPAGEFVISEVPYNEELPGLAFDGSNYLVAWSDSRLLDSNVFGSRVSPASEVLDSDGFIISTKAMPQLQPTVVFDNENYFVVWEENDNIYGTRVSINGDILDTPPTVICDTDQEQHLPRLATYPIGYFVTWQEGPLETSDIRGAIVGLDGEVQVSPFDIGSESQARLQYPDVAFNGQDFLVVWEDNRNDDGDIYGARVNQFGNTVDKEPFAIATGHGQQQAPAVVAGELDWLVVWDDLSRINGARVNDDASLMDSDPIVISQGPNTRNSAEVTFDGTNFFVVWTDTRTQEGEFDLYGARVAQTSEIIDPDGIPIFNGESQVATPTVSFDGAGFFVTWADSRSGDWDLFGTRVSTAGEVDESGDIELAATPVIDDYFPALASDGNGTALLVYHRFSSDPQYNGVRWQGRFISNLFEQSADAGIGGDGGTDGGADAAPIELGSGTITESCKCSLPGMTTNSCRLIYALFVLFF